MTTLQEANDALLARFALAFAAAQTVLSTILAAPNGQNLKRWIPDASSSYLRLYWKPVSVKGYGLGQGFTRHNRNAIAQIMIPEETGDGVIVPIFEAIELAAFVSDADGDGLIFELPADMSDGHNDASHHTVVGMFPHYFDRQIVI